MVRDAVKRGWRRLFRFIESGTEEYGIRFADRTGSQTALDFLEAVELESR
ncbi:MAG TPA: hypothetical protein VK869_11875 [Rubrobacteraceae bacterium]|nr:hypothetical protein [Rubrobacteraceae bacterium]